MEIFGGFMIMMSIIGLFLAVIWLVMPFVVFAIKGKQDRSLELLESIEKRLSTIDEQLARLHPGSVPKQTHSAPHADDDLPASNRDTQPPVLPLA